MLKQELQNLNAEKKQLEDELIKLKEELEVYRERGFEKALIDNEGFPRADLDFAELSNYRNLKRTFQEKNNDYTALMKKVEKALYAYHEQLQKDPNVIQEMEKFEQEHQRQQPAHAGFTAPKKSGDSAESKPVLASAEQKPMDVEFELIKPFAILNEVTPHSPADAAGFKLGDYIVRFGAIDYSNHQNLSNLSKFVEAKKNSEVNVKILRLLVPHQEIVHDFSNQSYIITDLKITPQKWAGNGLLGCRFKIV